MVLEQWADHPGSLTNVVMWVVVDDSHPRIVRYLLCQNMAQAKQREKMPVVVPFQALLAAKVPEHP